MSGMKGRYVIPEHEILRELKGEGSPHPEALELFISSVMLKLANDFLKATPEHERWVVKHHVAQLKRAMPTLLKLCRELNAQADVHRAVLDGIMGAYGLGLAISALVKKNGVHAQAAASRKGKAAKRVVDPAGALTDAVVESVYNANVGTKRSDKAWNDLLNRELKKKGLPLLKPRSTRMRRYRISRESTHS
jgi:hypothetical protein